MRGTKPIEAAADPTFLRVAQRTDHQLLGQPHARLPGRHDDGAAGEQEQPWGRNIDNSTESLSKTAFQLFDGQQRLLSLLLGLGVGALCDSRKLWVDIGQKPRNSEDRLFVLRMNSTGQPFGYKPDKPNEKVAAGDRREAHQNWPTQDRKLKSPTAIFKEMTENCPGELSSATCAVPLSRIMSSLTAKGKKATAEVLQRLILNTKEAANVADIKGLLTGLQKALNAEIVVKLVEGPVLDENNHRRFFARLGQGGTRLSDEELTYSLIKDRYPHVHDRVTEIVQNSGRLASEVDLVLAALRVAQTLEPWPNAKEGELAGRPTPERVQSVHEMGRETTEPYFRSMLLENESAPCPLWTAIRNLRSGLLYDQEENPYGLPSMLLARLPRDLLDVLLLFTFKRGVDRAWEGDDRTTLIAFVLHWLIFVANDEKAAYDTFAQARDTGWCLGQNAAAALIRHFETMGIARHAPREDDWCDLGKEIQDRGCMLAKWTDRFSSKDDPNHASPGEALRALSTQSELLKRALMWLQRHYITHAFAHYDPTSTRDDDMPFDLDHAVPHELFGFHWSDQRKPVDLSGPEETRFKDLRHTIGDSLGNFRWLSAADNRGRGMKKIEPERGPECDKPPLDDLIERCRWNALIDAGSGKNRWTKDHVATFQRLIDGRTLSLTEKLMREGGIAKLLQVADSLNTPPAAPPDV